MGKKRKFEVEQKNTNEFSLPAKFLATSHVRAHEKRLIVILEGAQLETVKVMCRDVDGECAYIRVSVDIDDESRRWIAALNRH